MTPKSAAARRLDHIRAALGLPESRLLSTNPTSGSESTIQPDEEPSVNPDEAKRLCIGDVCMDINTPNAPDRVPIDVCVDVDSEAILEHLQWMMQKYMLGQDIFLSGPPGPLRRHLAHAFCALLQLEAEYVCLHRDTSAESDLKQRREILRTDVSQEDIRKGAVVPDRDIGDGLGKLKAEWVDSAAVRAAVEGRVLIIEGIEKAERNVLPVLNNLLENREINLEDGRHLVNPKFYDNLLQQGHTREELESWKLVRVDPNFRVIALGIPVPPYKGNLLDPPFRSRFQVRYVDGWTVGGTRLGMGAVVRGQSEEAIKAASEFMKNANFLAETVKYSWRLEEDTTISSTAGNAGLIPYYPQTSVPTLSTLLSIFPAEASQVSLHEALLERVYPYSGLTGGMSPEQRESYDKFLARFNIGPKTTDIAQASEETKTGPAPELKAVKKARRSRFAVYEVEALSRTSAPVPVDSERPNGLPAGMASQDLEFKFDTPMITVSFRNRFQSGAENLHVVMPCGPANLTPPASVAESVAAVLQLGDGRVYVDTPRYRDAVTRMIQAHAIGSDIAVVGPKGSGKSTAIHRFAALMGYSDGWTETVHCYKDMTARDFLQRRGTRRDGSTYWENSGLVVAATEGKLCILDGVDMLEAGTLASIQRLVQDREMPLPDGSHLVSARTFQDHIRRTGMSPSYLTEVKHIFPIHPSFRIVATSSTPAHPPASGNVSEAMPWLTEEILNMFHFVEIGAFARFEEEEIVKAVTKCPEPQMKVLLDFAEKFRSLSHEDTAGQSGVLSKAAAMSTRQIIRICKRLTEHPNEDLNRAIHRTCLSPFLPQLARDALELLLKEVDIAPVPREKLNISTPRIEPVHGQPALIIGDVHHPVYKINERDPEGSALVPRVPTAFFDNELHTLVMREMALDFGLGEHLLLIGNQGVGKNRLTDRFLELINRPREYIQLHRDTTVQSLMVQPTVENGVIVYKDSPLVRAVQMGRVLVVDEADKAPVYITAVLKSLAENGEMTLTDGRRIRPPSAKVSGNTHARDIILHPDFRLILLANRPGYPFLGNDFYSAIGDVLSTHAVDNPDPQSELSLLSQAAPGVSRTVLRRLVEAFGDLRVAFDEGLVAYPYSLRELMNLVRHLQEFPDDSLDLVLRNVFDFDVMRKEYHDILLQILNKHGVPVKSLGLDSVNKTRSAGKGKARGLFMRFEGKPRELTEPKEGKVDPKGKPHVGGNTWKGGTGGSSTAGLGGRGGPYRLDLGHNVFQMPDEEKNKVPEAVKRAAREMATDGLRKRLEEIQMSEYDAGTYKEFYDNVKHEIRQLRVVLEGVQAKEKERVWLKHQVDGDLDDSKLIDGLTGDRAVYKRRGQYEPEYGAQQKKPKRLKFVFDVSGSMYRFNGLDGRLNRSLEAALMSKYKYDISGHSGDADSIAFTSEKKPPATEVDRLKVLQQMVAHSQFCFSGDNTLEAAQKAINEIAKEDADDHIVVLLSDANLRRYGIRPEDMAKILTSNEKVNAVCLFIGTLGDEARILQKRMPAGKAFIAMNTSDIPKIMREIFMSVI
ncbi:hypothetical protein M427DRAFT_33874 [Gonapodya prolifera JEL478]|uniref:von Willebrand factor A domain-containing protein 8 n=1 Tax=Gonapodya prolifera (strain JEL478) TaxID=1344416 RepID=A0A139A9W1_GONPJ|nr:hypothetical protein M427DRAFT_33874 [Gonapodya prolifera JEL478]|eukprot:KXS13469.1 hypothetical protein M427DRAFT_33874 [Gonapodya prolifera JEL478]